MQAQRLADWTHWPTELAQGYLPALAAEIMTNAAMVEGDDGEKFAWMHALHNTRDLDHEHISHMFAAARARKYRSG